MKRIVKVIRETYFPARTFYNLSLNHARTILLKRGLNNEQIYNLRGKIVTSFGDACQQIIGKTPTLSVRNNLISNSDLFTIYGLKDVNNDTLHKMLNLAKLYLNRKLRKSNFPTSFEEDVTYSKPSFIDTLVEDDSDQGSPVLDRLAEQKRHLQQQVANLDMQIAQEKQRIANEQATT